jgi:predicted transcriptional regulator
MNKVSDILARKGSKVTSVLPQTTVLEALRIMAEQNIGSVMVMEGNHFLGVITERDYCRKVVLHGRSSTDTEVAEIMSTGFPRIVCRFYQKAICDTCPFLMEKRFVALSLLMML